METPKGEEMRQECREQSPKFDDRPLVQMAHSAPKECDNATGHCLEPDHHHE